MKLRLNFLVRVEVRELFESLQERLDADSMTEVLRRAIFVFDWYVALRERGARLVAVDSDGRVSELPGEF